MAYIQTNSTTFLDDGADMIAAQRAELIFPLMSVKTRDVILHTSNLYFFVFHSYDESGPLDSIVTAAGSGNSHRKLCAVQTLHVQ